MTDGAELAPGVERVSFLLSPASLHGRRGERLLAPRAAGELAGRLEHGVAIGELFSAVSTLYFRGKLAYALGFGGSARTRIIAPGLGLVPPSRRIDRSEARRMAAIPVRADEPAYRRPLERSLRRVAARGGSFVFLGSLATERYLSVLEPILGDRLLAPRLLYGMGNMKRGSVLLRAVEAGEELEYVRCRVAREPAPVEPIAARSP